MHPFPRRHDGIKSALCLQVLGQDARETLLQRLKDPDALNTESEKEAFLQEVFAAAQHIINQKLDGNPQPPHLDEIMAVLVEISAMKRRFRRDFALESLAFDSWPFMCVF